MILVLYTIVPKKAHKIVIYHNVRKYHRIASIIPCLLFDMSRKCRMCHMDNLKYLDRLMLILIQIQDNPKWMHLTT